MDGPMSKPFNLGGSSCLLRKKGAMLYNLNASRKVALKLTRTSHGMFVVSANNKKVLTSTDSAQTYLQPHYSNGVSAMFNFQQDKHCQHHIAVMGVVDTFRQCYVKFSIFWFVIPIPTNIHKPSV